MKTSQAPLEKGREKTWRIGETDMVASISPCSWLYPDYGLQIQVCIPKSGSAYLHIKKRFDECVDADFDELCSKVKLVACKTCGKPAFDPEAVDTNRDGECEDCFLAALNAEYQKSLLKEKKKLARRDKSMLVKGYQYRVTAWIHPAAGGDDYMVDIYFAEKPTPKAIKKHLANAGSCVFDDYTITLLGK